MNKLVALWFLLLVLVSCNGETSLQEYYVENQNSQQFLAFDIPASLLAESEGLTAEQKTTLSTIKKVNVLGFPKKEGNEALYEQEKEKVSEILKDEKYHELLVIGQGATNAQIFYLGEEDAIDEFIVFGSHEDKGFGIARVTGEDMDPEALIKFFKSAEKEGLDLNGLPNLNGMFKD